MHFLYVPVAAQEGFFVRNEAFIIEEFLKTKSLQGFLFAFSRMNKSDLELQLALRSGNEFASCFISKVKADWMVK